MRLAPRRWATAGIQWILQNRAGEHWRSRSFCQTKEALIRCGGSTPELDALPDRIAPVAEKFGGKVATVATTDTQEAAE